MPKHLDPMPALYDAENPWGADDDFFLSVLEVAPGSRVADLGCGTGRLTVAMAERGYAVTGIDPNRSFLEAARSKPWGDHVGWIQGTSACLAPDVFDAALMTSHVAQVFLTDEAWHATLSDLERALVPGGVLAFDTRDPRGRAWDRWKKTDTHGRVELADGTLVECWMDVTAVVDGVVSFEWHNIFPDGSNLHGVSSLRFRSEEVVRDSVEAVGLRVEDIFGGWHGEAVGSGAGELVVIARA